MVMVVVMMMMVVMMMVVVCVVVRGLAGTFGVRQTWHHGQRGQSLSGTGHRNWRHLCRGRCPAVIMNVRKTILRGR
uniref:Putative secreted protein n=1 Tax=Panstrongylus lignarius TaxID=156445 RepID=A0A224XX32_9HEMI